jgi:predicted transposase/invertase (TIGR01784 family)
MNISRHSGGEWQAQRWNMVLRLASLCTLWSNRKHDILKEFMEEHAKEVMNMLTTEWNWDTAKEVWQEEAREEGREEGVLTTARNALEEGLSVEMVQKITDLSLETIERLT